MNESLAVTENIGTATTGNQEEATEAEQAEKIKQKKIELEKAESKVTKYQSKTDALTQKAETLEEVIGELNEEVTNTEQAIQKAQSAIDKVQAEIDIKVQQINEKEKELDAKRAILSEYIREINRLSGQSMVEVLLSADDLASYLQELNSLNKTSSNIQEIYNEIKGRRSILLVQKEKLEKNKENQTALKIMQKQQKMYLENKKQHRDNLLQKTRGEESQFRELLEQNEVVVDRIYGELTALQSLGSPIDFKEALYTARYASKKTGTRVEFLLGVLKVESNMGVNVGGGTYKVDMHPAQRDRFEKICEDLGYDPDEKPVSRKPCYRDSEGNCSGWGGAMGPAQFMPSTWMGYKKSIEKTINIEHANPWNLRHALVAMGLKLAKVPGVTEGDEKAERKAANIYLAGSNWENFTWYGDRVIAFADAFKDKIKEENL
ncbi:MAG: hypothetical protein U9Q72_00055 [Patescibacteria group bacterium]|nr:hypothetical protein [Patescibacteria group bacterium]